MRAEAVIRLAVVAALFAAAVAVQLWITSWP